MTLTLREQPQKQSALTLCVWMYPADSTVNVQRTAVEHFRKTCTHLQQIAQFYTKLNQSN